MGGHEYGEVASALAREAIVREIRGGVPLAEAIRIADAEINRDASLRLEYLAGLSLWLTEADEIFQEIAAHRRYPTEILKNDAEYRDDIRLRLGLPVEKPAPAGPSKQP